MIEVAPRPVVAEPTTTMKPSEALRLGSLNTRQIFGALEDGFGGFCALGTIMNVMRDAKPVPLDVPLGVPCGCVSQLARPWSIVVHLNDEHRWSRGEIADWLESEGL
jgi:hypothetical protein